MSTRSTIILRVKPEDQGKTYRQPKEFFQKINAAVYQGNIGEFKITRPYIGIYCHHDAYLLHMGKVLTEKFNNYEDVLNLVAGGDTSYIDEGGVGYYAGPLRNEDWCDEYGRTRLIRCLDDIRPVSRDSKYIYVFDYETGKWKYSVVPWEVPVIWKLEELADVEEALQEH